MTAARKTLRGMYPSRELGAVPSESLAFIAGVMGLRGLISIISRGLPTISKMEEDRSCASTSKRAS